MPYRDAIRLTPGQAIHALGAEATKKEDALVDMFLRIAEANNLCWRHIQYLGRAQLVAITEAYLKKKNGSQIEYAWRDPLGSNAYWEKSMRDDIATFMREMELI